MTIDLSHADVVVLRELLAQRVLDLDREIAATENLRFKEELRNHARTVERILGVVTTALERSPDRPA